MKFIFAIIIIICCVFLTDCKNSNDELNPIEIDFKNDSVNENNSDKSNDSIKSLNLAIAAMTSPDETYIYYNELIHYISKKLNCPINVIQRKTYSEVNKLLTSGDVDMAFICSGAYVNAMESKLPIEILTIPIIKNKTSYNAYIIVNTNSGIETFKQLKNKTFAYTDPMSNTGYLYAISLIKSMNEDANKYFAKTIYTHGHDYAIQSVEKNLVDGASVHSLIFDYIKTKHPEKVSHINIINVSEPFGIPPIVVRKNLNSKLKTQLKDILLNVHKNPEGNDILKKLQIDKYTIADSTNYKSIFEIYKK